MNTISRNIPYFIVDVFGQEKYSGNQLAVFPYAAEISSEEMQSIARETNYSETTFITNISENSAEIDVRIFTPDRELPFAGHPTLGTAVVANSVLYEGRLNSVSLNVKAGKIPVEFSGELVWMKQIQPEFAIQVDKNDAAEALGLTVDDIMPDFPVEWVSTGLPFIIVPLKSMAALKAAKVNQVALEAHFGKYNSQEFMVFTTESYNETDAIASRVFVTEYGIPEDPATGSANGCLAAYLVKHKFYGKSMVDISVAQGYEIHRPSRLHLKACLIEELYDIRIGGKVIPIAEGSWF